MDRLMELNNVASHGHSLLMTSDWIRQPEHGAKQCLLVLSAYACTAYIVRQTPAQERDGSDTCTTSVRDHN